MNTQPQQKIHIHPKAPFVSVLVCSLNGEKRIGDCLKSISKQTYRRENFEIVVVDDGSIDGTSVSAQNLGARVIRFEKNRGIPVARNAGIFSAKGDIVVFIDDDCVADSYWLENLIRAFKDETIVAVGGKILALSRNTLAERYMEASGYGNPARPPKDSANSLIGRLTAYFNTMVSPIMMEKNIVDVLAIYTASAGYRKEVLVNLGGFDELLKSGEDSDISARIRACGGRIVYAPSAVVQHRHYKNITKVISEPYRRAQDTVRFYLKDRKIPPIFPMPILYIFFLFVSVLLFYKNLILFIAITTLLPVVLYGWWVIRGFREHRLEYLCYSYIQLIAESVVMAGFLKGLFGILSDRICSILNYNFKK